MFDTLNKFFKITVKHVNKSGLHSSKGIRVPQSIFLSSLLANVYLDEFDRFIDSLKKEVDKGTLTNNTTKE